MYPTSTTSPSAGGQKVGSRWAKQRILVANQGSHRTLSGRRKQRLTCNFTRSDARGGERNRTAVQGFAVPCLNHSATPPERATVLSAATPPRAVNDLGRRQRDCGGWSRASAFGCFVPQTDQAHTESRKPDADARQSLGRRRQRPQPLREGEADLARTHGPVGVEARSRHRRDPRLGDEVPGEG